MLLLNYMDREVMVAVRWTDTASRGRFKRVGNRKKKVLVKLINVEEVFVAQGFVCGQFHNEIRNCIK